MRPTEPEIEGQLLRLSASIRLDDEIRPRFMEVIRIRTPRGQIENKRRRENRQRQHAQVEAELSTLLDIREDGEITPGESTA